MSTEKFIWQLTMSQQDECSCRHRIESVSGRDRLEARPQVIQPFLSKCRTDLFATRLTRQLKQYINWRPDTETFSTDALSVCWRNLQGHTFLPFNLVPAVLQCSSRPDGNHAGCPGLAGTTMVAPPPEFAHPRTCVASEQEASLGKPGQPERGTSNVPARGYTWPYFMSPRALRNRKIF
jgi:hypothetical protein